MTKEQHSRMAAAYIGCDALLPDGRIERNNTITILPITDKTSE